jgi:hypothetical protein
MWVGINQAKENGVCNGVFIDRGGSRCISFKNGAGLSTLPPSLEPTQPPPSFTSAAAAQGGVGYFNYDVNVYGPIIGWGKFRTILSSSIIRIIKEL